MFHRGKWISSHGDLCQSLYCEIDLNDEVILMMSLTHHRLNRLLSVYDQKLNIQILLENVVNNGRGHYNVVVVVFCDVCVLNTFRKSVMF